MKQYFGQLQAGPVLGCIECVITHTNASRKEEIYGCGNGRSKANILKTFGLAKEFGKSVCKCK